MPLPIFSVWAAAPLENPAASRIRSRDISCARKTPTHTKQIVLIARGNSDIAREMKRPITSLRDCLTWITTQVK
ncbi:MAG: hypothetical protein WA405_07685 [Candidatus Acidiferrales bacterium]